MRGFHLEQDQAISHQFTAIRRENLRTQGNNDHPERQAQSIDLQELSEERCNRAKEKRRHRLKNAQVDYLKTFPKRGKKGKFYPRDLEELLEIVDQGRLIESFMLALEAGFMIGYRTRSKECPCSKI